jgi:hypothetical protein
MYTRTILAGATSFTVAAFLLLPGVTAGAKPKGDTPDHVTFHSWSFRDTTVGGTYNGTADSGPALTITTPTRQRTYTDPFATSPAAQVYDEGDWTSPDVDTAYGLTQLVASWNAHTPGGSWIEVDVQGVAPGGTASSWYVMGRWADDDTAFHPTSSAGQSDALGHVSVDTLMTASGTTFTSYRLRVELMRPQGSSVTPSVGSVGAMASAVPDLSQQPTSPTSMTSPVTLDVPTYSQELHRGEFPEFDNGGEAWCSPTSSSMVVAYWGRGPSDAELQSVRDRYPNVVDPQVDVAARHVFDYSYDGAGNWPFNAAYAATYGLDGFVTRLRNLTEAEQFIKAGIPLVVSLSFKKNELDGAGYGTGGHLMVIVGFTANGDVVVNDPASHLIPSDDQVRVTYDRAQFEHAWLTSSQGVVYVVHPSDVPLPPAPAEANW